jgi:hypothetical protein
MPENDITDTKPNKPVGNTQPIEKISPEPVEKKTPMKKLSRWFALIVVVVLIILGALAGYGSGMGQRNDAEKTQISGQVQEQFNLGVEKMEAGQYDLAKVHFDFVIEHDPKYPGLVEAYADLLIRMQTSPTPTYTATPTVTPTPDLRGVEAIYANLQSALSVGDWDTVLTNLDSLRKTDPDYKTAEVDGLYYLALRMRGVDKIILEDGESCGDINLEGGIFDLTQAERFGTLDAVAEGLRGISRLYIIGASYWDQDWDQVQTIFDQVRLGNPYLRDSSCMTATERWRFATIKRAQFFIDIGDVCAAEEQFNLAFSIVSDYNIEFYPTATENSIQCDGDDGGGGGGGGDATPTEQKWHNGTETP